MTHQTTGPTSEGPHSTRSLSVEGSAGVTSFEETQSSRKGKISLSPDSLKGYQALYEGVPSLKSVANDPLVELAPTDLATPTRDIQTPDQLYTLFSLLADMGVVFKAQGAKMRSVNQELGAISGQINNMLNNITTFSNAIATTNAELKADEPPKWLQVIEGIAFAVIGVAMGAAIGGPVAAVAAAVVGIGNVIMTNATIKTADGKEENLWDASLGGLNPAEQFWVKLVISVAAGVIAGAGTAALSNFAQSAADAAVSDVVGDIGEGVEGDIEMQTFSPSNLENEELVIESESSSEGTILENEEVEGEEQTQKQVNAGKEKALSSWAEKHPILAQSIMPNVGRRAFLQGANVFLQVASDVKSNVKSDDKSPELGLLGDLAKWCGMSDDKAGYFDYITSGLQVLMGVGSGIVSATNPSNIPGLVGRVFARLNEVMPMVSAGLEGGASIGNAVTELKISHLYSFLASLTQHVDIANKDMQTLEWDQRILNGMLRQTVKENTSSMQTINSVLETIQVGLSSQGHQRA
ncbi:MAG: hypothetical protein JSR80_03580 [Verrucomicrobia bacterium]|nr:hypothetical protein [Verrucomicrobiota bacterium]